MDPEPGTALFGLVILAAVHASITSIITESSLFEPLRDLAKAKNEQYLGTLIACPLCAGTWIAAGIAAPTVWKLGYTGIDALLAGLVVTFATLTGGLIFKRLTDF